MRGPIPELEFDQTANLAAEAGHDHWTHLTCADAKPIPELVFDQTLGLQICAAQVAHAAECGWVWCRRRQGVLCGGVRAPEFPIRQYGDFPYVFRIMNQKDGPAPVLFSYTTTTSEADIYPVGTRTASMT